MLNSLSIVTFPLFETSSERQAELLKLIESDKSIIENLRYAAADVYGYEFDETEDLKPESFVDMIVSISDSATIVDRSDLATMSVCDFNGALFRVCVAAEFMGERGIIADSNVSNQYADMQLLNASDRIWQRCEYYSKIDCAESA